MAVLGVAEFDCVDPVATAVSRLSSPKADGCAVDEEPILVALDTMSRSAVYRVLGIVQHDKNADEVSLVFRDSSADFYTHEDSDQ
jgi:hypothetical protein